MYVVITRVSVEERSIDQLAELFDDTNRDLVTDHEDWIGAWFTANRSTNEVTVLAQWRDAAAYERLRSSDGFQSTMARFVDRFTGPPTISVNEILVEM